MKYVVENSESTTTPERNTLSTHYTVEEERLSSSDATMPQRANEENGVGNNHKTEWVVEKCIVTELSCINQHI